MSAAVKEKRALRKQVTNTGNIRLDGDTDDSHCDRLSAKVPPGNCQTYEERFGILG